MLMSPPKPPKPSMTSDSATASTIGSFHGSAAIQPKSPRPPRARPRQNAPEELKDDAVPGPCPQQRGRADREHRERHRLTRIIALPRRHVVDHQRDPDHRAADQQQSAEVIPRASQQWRIESIEY